MDADITETREDFKVQTFDVDGAGGFATLKDE
jgi:hypothetical protein